MSNYIHGTEVLIHQDQIRRRGHVIGSHKKRFSVLGFDMGSIMSMFGGGGGGKDDAGKAERDRLQHEKEKAEAKAHAEAVALWSVVGVTAAIALGTGIYFIAKK
jgi:hypothetical protein